MNCKPLNRRQTKTKKHTLQQKQSFCVHLRKNFFFYENAAKTLFMNIEDDGKRKKKKKTESHNENDSEKQNCICSFRCDRLTL